MTFYGVVTEQDIVELFEAHRATARRLAERICGPLEGEDVVSDVVAWLLEHRDYLQSPPGVAYFFQAVTNNARRRLLYAWARYVVAMDQGDLVLAEQAMEGQRRGNGVEPLVRLPEPVA
jgi:DNA-directed RNA polymerase specialized sigma24 family protein